MAGVNEVAACFKCDGPTRETVGHRRGGVVNGEGAIPTNSNQTCDARAADASGANLEDAIVDGKGTDE